MLNAFKVPHIFCNVRKLNSVYVRTFVSVYMCLYAIASLHAYCVDRVDEANKQQLVQNINYFNTFNFHTHNYGC